MSDSRRPRSTVTTTPMGKVLPEASRRCNVSPAEPAAYRNVCGRVLRAGRMVRVVVHARVARRPQSELVLRSAGECAGFLSAHKGEDWTQPIPDMTWSVRRAASHTAAGLLWYSADFTAGLPELSTMDPKFKEDSPPADLIRSIDTFARMLAAVIDAAPPGARGFHPAGNPDASGFAAIACDEMLIHTDDAARGLGADFIPSPDIAEATLRRIFPWAPRDLDPWTALRWANGRIAVRGLEVAKSWRWHCAPLDEWDGTNPNSPG